MTDKLAAAENQLVKQLNAELVAANALANIHSACRDSAEREVEKLREALAACRAGAEMMVARCQEETAKLTADRDRLREQRDAAEFTVRGLAEHRDRLLAEVERLKKIERDRNYALQCQNEQLEVVVDERNELREMKGVNAWADAIRAKAALANAMPRIDEVDSVMSLLNWTRQHHDADSSARCWLERVVAAAICDHRGTERDEEDICCACGARADGPAARRSIDSALATSAQTTGGSK